MTVLRFIEIMMVSAVVFTAIDLVWLGVVAKRFYYKYLGHLLRTKADPVAAAAFYLLYHVGMAYFVLVPALHAGSGWLAVMNGGLYGLVTYGTYDLTNLATTKDWSRRVAVVDMIWGTVLSGTVAGICWALLRLF